MLHDATRLSLSVRPNDLDALGHVNNAVVLEYLEAGRRDWLRRIGGEPGGDAVAVVARIEIDYRAELPYGQLEVVTELESPTAEEVADEALTFRALLRQRVRLPGTREPAAEALVTVAFLDARQRCPITLQDYLSAVVAD
ncbi:MULTISPECIES: acyl-CoA thioesterase [unclassified Streptomyces]|uniref:acyl-CoA thioesterase n=1 Tax=unclassified Streptomyces TaxID=2593676 RepID=UPI00223764C1|nr:acyl-CoA thioesterase [Streptomyces sp. SHP 1-2]MCW5253393.1 acyl-CoA thioesterase [Streptomyces sp. SHP 1-2]